MVYDREARMGTKWWGEYACFCLGNNLNTVAAYLLGYALGRAHENFELARDEPTTKVSTLRSRIYG